MGLDSWLYCLHPNRLNVITKFVFLLLLLFGWLVGWLVGFCCCCCCFVRFLLSCFAFLSRLQNHRGILKQNASLEVLILISYCWTKHALRRFHSTETNSNEKTATGRTPLKRYPTTLRRNPMRRHPTALRQHPRGTTFHCTETISL